MMMHGSKGVERLGIPDYNWWNEALHGVARAGLATVYPQTIGMAATFDPQTHLQTFTYVSDEARAKYNDAVSRGEYKQYYGLTFWTPNINIFRDPRWGRGQETYGEDPFLTARMGVATVKGLQGDHPDYYKTHACAKHFAVHSGPEWNRHSFDVVVSSKDLWETYLPAFESLVKEGDVREFMGAYNRYDGDPCCGSAFLLQDVLRGKWNYQGLVVSDCWAINDFYVVGHHETHKDAAAASAAAVLTGTDVECGSAYVNLKQAVEEGLIAEKDIDVSVRRLLNGLFELGFFDPASIVPWSNIPYSNVDSQEHKDHALKVARQSVVLLKNENNILPLDLEKTPKILVVGENAIKKMTVGGGSSSLKAQNECTPIVGLQEAIGDKAQITYQRGYVGDLLRTYNSVDTGIDLTDPRTEEELIADAVAAAKEADIVLFFGGLNKSKGQDAEGRDRAAMALPYAQDKVIDAITEVNKNVVVLIVSGNAVEMPWIDKVDGVVETWYLGSQAGHAIADVLLGKVNPSGKLPFTFPVKLEDNGAHALNAYHKDSLSVEYKEGIYVGYRWAEKQNIKPLFAFGHGLSYTTFEYSEAKCNKSGSGYKVTLNVTNTGAREGKEIVQLYISDEESSLERPVKELKGFKKVTLAAGETKKVTFEITEDMLKFYDPEKGWVLEKGKFTAHVGAASDDIRTTVDFTK